MELIEMALEDFKERYLSNLCPSNDGTDEDYREGSSEEKVNILEKMAPKTKIILPRLFSKPNSAVQSFEREVKDLQEAGLDIGKGDANYGYKIPLPESDSSGYRKLIIFRRR